MTNQQKVFDAWRNDWNLFIKQCFGVNLDEEQQAVVSAVQHNKMVSVRSGTARGKDFLSACIALSFLYLTPRWNKEGQLIANTKVALTAPTARQCTNIMMPEVARLLNRAISRGFDLPGRLTASDIRMDNKEWFLTAFKADENNHEAWSGFHAVNTMFIVTEASGINDDTYAAIEGNLQGNSRILLVFNPNSMNNYAAKSQFSPRWKKFALSSLHAPNVKAKKVIIQGQVDFDWVQDKVDSWCVPITRDEYNPDDGDIEWEGGYYRPNDTFRVKVMGLFPKVSNDTLIPMDWIESANKRWREKQSQREKIRQGLLRLGGDVAGMGRDSSVLCPRYDDFVDEFEVHQSNGKADHMRVVGMIVNHIRNPKRSKAFIDTIGEGAGVYSRLGELGYNNAYGVKFSENAKGLHDVTEQYSFVNMRSYCIWAIRDWLNPKNGNNACLPPCDQLAEELTSIKWEFDSSGKIKIESKDSIKEKIKRSPDYSDSLAMTFYPRDWSYDDDDEILRDFL